ncbi:Cholecystokinin receptor [Holothuria leucospilota]|uniref:Cholecystokinin receptor n=1 Tax=Holothuria leucospilota TaxID=206669 RepID=A0A9Q1H5Q4_HOLLE|nr:Cholecystokinin receptor [Holothuria leucospilota]
MLTDDTRWSAASFLRIMYLIFGLIGLIGNGLVLFVFLRVRSLRTITNLFIGNQSLIDLVSSILLLVSKFRNENTNFEKLSRGYGVFVCLFWTSDYIYWALLVSSTTNLVFLTLERYIAVVMPIFYRMRVTWKTATISAIFPWVFGLIFELFWPAVHRLSDGNCYPDWRSGWIQAIVGIIIFVVEHIVPIVVMIVVYTGIVRKLRAKVGVHVQLNSKLDPDTGQPNETLQTNPSQGNLGLSTNGSQNQAGWKAKPALQSGEQQQQSMPQKPEDLSTEDRKPDLRQRVRSNVIKTLFLVAFVYIICWTPNQVIFLLYNLSLYDLDFNGAVYISGVSLAFCNMWINPFIYTFKYRKFQKGLRKVFCLGSSDTDDTLNTGTTLNTTQIHNKYA